MKTFRLWASPLGLLPWLLVMTGGHSQKHGAAIAGEVRDGVSNRPIASASVVLSRVQLGNRSVRIATVESDPRGLFRFDGLPDGNYDVAARRTGYLNGRYGQLHPGGAGVQVRLTASAEVAPLLLTLWPPVAIGGSVFDERGEPAVGTTVSARRIAWEAGSWLLRDAGTAKVDDRGRYRIPSLYPGKYLVVAAPVRSVSGKTPAALYFPAVLHPSQAAVLNLSEPGADHDGTNITLLQTTGADVTGEVTGIDGAPRWARVSMWELFSATIRLELGTYSNRENGSFRFANVPPGLYRLEARASENDDQLRTSVFRAIQDLSVAGASVEGIRLALEGGATVAGMIDASGFATELSKLRLELRDLDAPQSARGVPPPGGPVGSDGRFSFSGVPAGRYVLVARELPEGVSIASAVIGAADILGVPLEVPSGGIGNIRIRLTDRRTLLTGQVLDAEGRPTARASVVILPDDARYWPAGHIQLNIAEGRPATAGRLRTTRPASDGTYAFDDVPPGRYRLVALERGEPDDLFAPDSLKRIRAVGTLVTVESGGRHVVALKPVPMSGGRPE